MSHMAHMWEVSQMSHYFPYGHMDATYMGINATYVTYATYATHVTYTTYATYATHIQRMQLIQHMK